ncbi:hypothetical protein C8R45DRAFT_1078136 [Mycena sanguinolenta]|nr:hypothetical protein C8R45DRAFT_1078136 [Mycena sanguinolenta]
MSLASNSDASHPQPQVVHNYYTSIYGGQGGNGGQGGEQGGSGGTGEGPAVHQHFPTSTGLPGSRLLNHCPPPSRIFHGRRTILDAMHQFFAKTTRKQKIYVLYGLGGAGKTQIALKFIEEWTYFTGRLLVDASTTETIETGLKNLATTKQTGNSLQDALSWLLANQEEWLLFFDNFFPKCNHGNIIITSRNPTLRGYGAYSQVSDMEESDAVKLLLKSADQEASDDNRTMALDIVKCNSTKELWYLPLAIVQAGAFILESGTLDTYLDLFIKNHTELLKKKSSQSHDDYAWAVYTTWEISFHKLSQPVTMFLQLCSFLHREDIFEEIFSRAAKWAFSSDTESSSVVTTKAREFLSYFRGIAGEWDYLYFLTVTNEIKAYSLINFDAKRKSFSIHPLVHSWSRTTLENPEPYFRCTDDILGTCIKQIPHQDRELASIRLTSHIDSLMQGISKLNTNFNLEYGHIYPHAKRYTEAEEFEVIAVERQKKLMGDEHWDTLNAMHSLSLTYTDLGRYEEAQKLQAVVVEKWRKLVGDDHLDTLHAMSNLASTYDNLGRSEEAEKLEVVVLEERKKKLGDDHLDTLHAMYNLAITYNSLGRYEEAEKLVIVVLEKRRKVLGDDHLDTLKARSNLAYTYASMGRFEEAEKLQVEVLEKTKKIIGADHLETLMVMAQLGYTYYSLGRFEQAEKLQVAVLEKRRKILGDDHLDILHAMNALANTYNSLSQFEETEKVQVALLEKRKKVLGDDHLDTLLVMQSLGTTYNRLGQLEEAEKLQVAVLEKRRKVLGGDHLDTLAAMEILAVTYQDSGQLKKAQELQVVVLKMRRKLLGDTHLDTLHTMNNLANTYGNLGQFEEAENLEVVVLEKWRQVLGNDHPDTLTVMSNLACTYYSQGHFVKAEELQVVALEKRRKLFGNNHPDTQQAVGNLALTYHSLGKDAEAIELESLLHEQ